MFSLNLLGPFSADIDGRPFGRFGTIRGQALLIYLALEHDHAPAGSADAPAVA